MNEEFHMSHNMTSIAEQLRATGYRVTPQRQIILDAICILGSHVTPDAVYAQVQKVVPSLNRATVYRTLHFLAEQRILTATLLADGRLNYELAGAKPHHHLVCRDCGASTELPHSILQRVFTEVKNRYHFHIETNHISFFGLCGHCHSQVG
jgi:Fur family transcriptional regulator, ferric uptake regulator